MELDATSWAVAGCSRLISPQYCMQKTSMKVVKWLLKLIILLDPFSRDRRRMSTTSHSSSSLITWRRRMRPLVPLPSRSRWRSSASISQSMQLASSSSPWSETTASWSSWERRGLERPLSWHRYLNPTVRDERICGTETSISTMIPVYRFHRPVLFSWIWTRQFWWASEHGLGSVTNFQLCACLLNLPYPHLAK